MRRATGGGNRNMAHSDDVSLDLYSDKEDDGMNWKETAIDRKKNDNLKSVVDRLERTVASLTANAKTICMDVIKRLQKIIECDQ
jgi:hypothetical protein